MECGNDPEGREKREEGRKMWYVDNIRSGCFGLFVFLFFFSSIFPLPSSICCYAEGIKEPNVAGSFYPSDKYELANLIKKYLDQADQAPVEGYPLVLIAPHAGYVYSGPVAAYGFNAIRYKDFNTVIVLAASHFFSYRGASVYAQGMFRTPLGDLEIDASLSRSLIDKDPQLLFFEPKFFEQEHSLEVQLPFLQSSLKPGFKIVPVLLGEVSYEECERIAQYLFQMIKAKNILLLASTDLSHYKPYEEARVFDQKTADFIKNLDAKGLWEAVAETGWNVCGFGPVVVSLLYAKMQGAKGADVLKMASSGDTAGDKSRVVGYASALIDRPQEKIKDHAVNTGDKDMLTKDEQKRLLEIARQTIESVVSGKKIPVFSESSPGLNLKRGVFVTLHKGKELRGCIGLFSSEDPLYQAVSQMSVSSSQNDYRFSPVQASELEDISIEISVLTEPQLIDDWKKIRLGVDGVIVRKGYSSGVFLPQVATETGWDLETFLGELCSQKAGLHREAYRDPSVKLYTFQAEIFQEED